jgi:2-keto-4-pentenoate hydratase/2-oxohepta-3-ene-1,7-dioic acid hydratase in catechol pathway
MLRDVLPSFLPAFAALLGSLGFHWEPAFDEVAPPGTFDDVAIADPSAALTFACTVQDGVPRVLAVRGYRQGQVDAIDLGSLLGRPVTSAAVPFRELGYDALAQAIAHAAPEHVVFVPSAQLVTPLDLGGAHVAAGTNYPEHAGEAGVKEGPFLFVKLVEATGPYSSVSAGDGLLDYEVEIALVPLSPIRAGDSPAHVGLVLANDYTDRATLLRHVDPFDVASGKGFTTGKSFPGYMPVGNLLVIPRDFRAFVPELELRLYVDGRLRQRERGRAMVWDCDELLRQTFSRASLVWDHRGAEVSLLGCRDALAEDTLLLTGTPHGTVFAGISSLQKARGLVRWAYQGFAGPVTNGVVETYVDDARAAGVFLKPGDEVTIHVDGLGVIRNRIVP